MKESQAGRITNPALVAVLADRQPRAQERPWASRWPIGSALARPRCPSPSPARRYSKRAAFLTRNLWVTPFDPKERFPAGEYPNQNPGGDGLPRWTTADRDLTDRDLVVWYTFGQTHIPRLEDWPVMPVVVGRVHAPARRLLRPQSRARPAAAGRGDESARSRFGNGSDDVFTG